ncbi:DUF5706 domain-containing protein [Actinoplanes sp. NBC_00393]|uniref:Pycsar system effector family protein n=1 Tax=Actinoplanes sp. NBC_00393 TaxID=2975953 RepID=UPI002E1F0292
MTTTDHLTTAITDVNAQMGRIDTKAAMLLAGSLTAASVGVAIIAKVPLTGPATTTAVLTVATICAAVILLMTAVRPALRGNHGFVRWAAAPTISALLTEFEQTDREHAAYQAHQLISLSRSVQRKYRLIRLATDLMRGAVVLAVLTALTNTLV